MENFLEREALQVYWSEVMADVERAVADDREDGWETVVVTPGDVTPIAGRDQPDGLDVLAPSSAFATVREWVRERGRTFERTEVFRRERESVVFLLLVLYDDPSRTSIYLPLYYHIGMAEEMLDAVAENGTIAVSLRSLSAEETVVFQHTSPELFAPPESE